MFDPLPVPPSARLRRPLGLLGFCGLAALCLTAAPPAARAQAPRYTIRGLGSLSGGVAGAGFSAARAVNSRGQVAGTSDVTDASGNHGSDAVLDSAGRITDLGNFGTSSQGFFGSSAYGINSAGQIVGVSDVNDPASSRGGGQAAFLYSGGALINLGDFGTDSQGSGLSIAYGLNDSGQVVGEAEVYDSGHNPLGSSAFLYSGGKMTNLGGLSADSQGNYNSHARAINKSGQIAGSASVYDGNHVFKGENAFFYSGGRMAGLGSLGTDSQGSSLSAAYGLNDAGQVVGEAEVYDEAHADGGWSRSSTRAGR